MSNWLLTDYIEVIINIIAYTILISGIDDAFIDICYWVRRAYRAIFITPKYPKITVEQLREKEEKPIAIMVPAWKEYDVIERMLSTNIRLIDYSNYRFFVGVYKNDKETSAEVDKAVNKDYRVKKVIVPHDGPTCKADCLNWVIQAILLYEKENSFKFSAICMHDSEDVIDPLELRLFNFLIPRKSFIQIPVRALEQSGKNFVSGSYIDEFAESHSKDLIVREALIHSVPSAGVATCFSREAIEALLEREANQPFNTDSLTEDYDICFRLNEVGMSQIFVTFPVYATREVTNIFGRKKTITVERPIAVTEIFPNNMWLAIRQKTRWVIGICFQSWSLSAWKGGLFRKYFFWRDRKGLILNIVTLMTYLLLIFFVIDYYFYKDTFRINLPAWLIWANTAILANRAFHRFYFVKYLYGMRQAFLSIPRILVSNIINASATIRAFYIFTKHAIIGKRIAWDKTQHEYPSEEIIKFERKRLGELLIDKKVLTQEQLDAALAVQQRTNKKLGEILVETAGISPVDLAEIVSAQTGYPMADLKDEDITVFMGLIPKDIALNFGVFPIGLIGKTKILKLAVTRFVPEDQIKKLVETNNGYPVQPMIVTDEKMEELLKLYKEGNA